MILYSFSPAILVPIAVAIAFALLRRYLAPGSPTLSHGVSMAELDSRFASMNWLIYLGMLLVGVIFGSVAYKSLVALNGLFAASEGPAYFRLLPSRSIWWFFPIFGALSLSWEITLFIWALFSKRQTVDLYIKWTSLKAGFDSTRTLRWMALLIALPTGVLTLLATPMHTTVHADEMRIRQYASLSSLKYRYKDARWMAIVKGFRERGGKFDGRAEILVKFADGYTWSSAANRDFTPTIDQKLVDFLSAKMNLPIQYAETESDLNLDQVH